MSATKTRRPSVNDQETHEEGLRAVAAVLAQTHAYEHLLALDKEGGIAPALMQHALSAADVRRSTTISLEMSERRRVMGLGNESFVEQPFEH